MYEAMTAEAFYKMAKRNARLTMQKFGNPAFIHYDPNLELFFFEYIEGRSTAITTFNVYVTNTD